MRSMQWARLIDIGLRVSVSQVGVWDLSHTAGCVISARPKPKYTKARLTRAKRAKQREARKKQRPEYKALDRRLVILYTLYR